MNAYTQGSSPLVAALKLAPTTYAGAGTLSAWDTLQETATYCVAALRLDPRSTPQPTRRINAFAARLTRRAATFLSRRSTP